MTPWHRRLLRALVVALPGALVLLADVAQRDPSAGDTASDLLLVAATAGLALLLGILVGLGVRAAHAVVVVVGAVAMTAGAVDGGLVVLALWWLGGAWVAVGLVALVDGTTRIRLQRPLTPGARR